MKKRLNKTQKEIEELAKQVPQLTDRQKEWAKHRFNYFVCVPQGKTESRCPNCKHIISLKERKEGSRWNKSDSTLRCPHCGATIQVNTRPSYMKASRHIHQDDFFEVMNVIGEWQITRLFYMQRYCYVRKDNTDWEFYEVCQAWNNPKHPKTYFRAFPKKTMQNYYFNPYRLCEWIPRYDENGKLIYKDDGYFLCDYVPCELEPRKVGGSNYFSTNNVCPGGRILPYYKQRGLTANAVRRLRKNAMYHMEGLSDAHYKPMYETLLKGQDYALYEEILDSGERDADVYFSALKICKRNNYNYKRNIREWVDLVDMLSSLGYDYRNPYYVCPHNLHQMHQRLVAARNRKMEEEELKRAEESNKAYRRRIGKFLGMDIHNKDLHIVVLPNVKAFKEEADHLCHCVYRCAYYDKKDSLILSARDGKGKRWETIEVSLKDFTIRQSYGYGDSLTKKHDEILNLVNENMWQIRECAKAPRAVC